MIDTTHLSPGTTRARGFSLSHSPLSSVEDPHSPWIGGGAGPITPITPEQPARSLLFPDASIHSDGSKVIEGDDELFKLLYQSNSDKRQDSSEHFSAHSASPAVSSIPGSAFSWNAELPSPAGEGLGSTHLLYTLGRSPSTTASGLGHGMGGLSLSSPISPSTGDFLEVPPPQFSRSFPGSPCATGSSGTLASSLETSSYTYGMDTVRLGMVHTDDNASGTDDGEAHQPPSSPEVGFRAVVGTDGISKAASARRKNSAKFTCTIAGCDRTFTAKHNLESTSYLLSSP